jgi:starvation-inducible DNA-binding protein
VVENTGALPAGQPRIITVLSTHEETAMRVDEPILHATRNDLPEPGRKQAVGLLNQYLADAISLQTHCKQAHWNVRGANFIALHRLFDEVNEAVEEYVDLLAERVGQLGGVAEGTVTVAASRSTLAEYPLGIEASDEHVEALSDSLASFGRSVRLGISAMDEAKDADSADILTEISRGIDKWLWFVEAHQQAGQQADSR